MEGSGIEYPSEPVNLCHFTEKELLSSNPGSSEDTSMPLY